MTIQQGTQKNQNLKKTVQNLIELLVGTSLYIWLSARQRRFCK